MLIFSNMAGGGGGKKKSKTNFNAILSPKYKPNARRDYPATFPSSAKRGKEWRRSKAETDRQIKIEQRICSSWQRQHTPTHTKRPQSNRILAVGIREKVLESAGNNDLV